MGSQRNYACVNCGRLFGRIYCASRHANNRVCGNGRILPLADYLAGRQVGRYSPSSFYRRHSVQEQPTDSITSLGTSVGVSSENFTSLQRRKEQLRNKGENQLIDGERLAKKFFGQLEDKWTEFQAEQAVSRLRKQYDHRSQQSNEIGANSVRSEPRHIFGYRGLACEKCLVIFTGAVYFGDRRYDRRHICDPSLLASYRDLDVQKDRIIKERRQEIPSRLKYAVSTGSYSFGAILHAIELSDPGNEPIKIANRKNPDETISILYSQEKCIELAANDNLGPGHWAIRAIRDGQAKLTEEELMDFLERVGDATFAVIGVKWPSVNIVQLEGQKPRKLYLMYLAID